jgi:hypothetical protein
MAVMRELPERRMESAKRERVKVDSGSLIYVDRNVYSVPSRFRMAFDALEEQHGRRGGKEYLRILQLAAKESYRLRWVPIACSYEMKAVLESCFSALFSIHAIQIQARKIPESK